MSLLIYGAYGYTGELLAREAVAKGLKPILAGRSAEKLRPVAEVLKLPHRVFSLDDPAAMQGGLSGITVVLNAAGPFHETAAPMVAACLEAKCHYADVNGEVSAFEHVFSQDARARDLGVTLLPGVGFDVVPTDCMALHVARKVPGARTLEIAFAILTRMSRGTARSFATHLHEGIWVRRGGKLVRQQLGVDARKIRFSDQERWTLPIPWGDLSTAYRTTGIPDITTYAAFPGPAIQAARLLGPLLELGLPLLETAAGKTLAARMVPKDPGPDPVHRARGKSLVWARAAGDGGAAESWLQTVEGYDYTAIAGIRAAQRLLAGGVVTGATTPGLAFGADFALEVPGTSRFDQLPGEMR